MSGPEMVKAKSGFSKIRKYEIFQFAFTILGGHIGFLSEASRGPSGFGVGAKVLCDSSGVQPSVLRVELDPSSSGVLFRHSKLVRICIF